jgi:hypothetical protein
VLIKVTSIASAIALRRHNLKPSEIVSQHKRITEELVILPSIRPAVRCQAPRIEQRIWVRNWQHRDSTLIRKATGRNEFTCDAVLPRLHQAERLDCSTQTGRCF